MFISSDLRVWIMISPFQILISPFEIPISHSENACQGGSGEIPKDEGLRALAFRFATQHLDSTTPPPEAHAPGACWNADGGGCWGSHVTNSRQPPAHERGGQQAGSAPAGAGVQGRGATGEGAAGAGGVTGRGNPDALPPAPWDTGARTRAAQGRSASVAQPQGRGGVVGGGGGGGGGGEGVGGRGGGGTGGGWGG